MLIDSKICDAVLPCYVPYTILQMHCLVMILYYTYQVGLNYSVFTQFYIGQKSL